MYINWNNEGSSLLELYHTLDPDLKIFEIMFVVHNWATPYLFLQAYCWVVFAFFISYKKYFEDLEFRVQCVLHLHGTTIYKMFLLLKHFYYKVNILKMYYPNVGVSITVLKQHSGSVQFILVHYIPLSKESDVTFHDHLIYNHA